jgi:hypothetical protein
VENYHQIPIANFRYALDRKDQSKTAKYIKHGALQEVQKCIQCPKFKAIPKSQNMQLQVKLFSSRWFESQGEMDKNIHEQASILFNINVHDGANLMSCYCN